MSINTLYRQTGSFTPRELYGTARTSGERARRRRYIYIYIYTCMCVCMYVCIHIYIYIDTYIYMLTITCYTMASSLADPPGPLTPRQTVMLRIIYACYNYNIFIISSLIF